jgi:two-component system chemotaxis response regulator CheY
MMPGEDGLSFLQKVRSRPRWSGIRAIVVSANGMPEDIAAARHAGADGYLTKPFSARELRATIDAFITNN